MPREPVVRNALADLAHATGVVIPVYFAPAHDRALGRALLEETLAAFCRELASPDAICLSVDGRTAGADIAADLAAAHKVQFIAGEENRGKLAPILNGVGLLLQNPSLKYLAIVDQDGDHFANELLNLIRAARHVERAVPTDSVMVLGRRISRHRPMGYLRGELEELADRMLLDALAHHAAARGQPLDLRFAATLDEFPDFHSGYKLFSRAAAEKTLAAPPSLEGMPEACAYRHAVEAVISVEALLAGATLAVVNRSTIDEQPLSAFGLLDRRRMIADKIIWPCKRLRVPPAFVAQWLDNHLPRLQLGSLVPEGKKELLAIRRLVRQAFALPDDAPNDILRLPFV